MEWGRRVYSTRIPGASSLYRTRRAGRNPCCVHTTRQSSKSSGDTRFTHFQREWHRVSHWRRCARASHRFVCSIRWSDQVRLSPLRATMGIARTVSTSILSRFYSLECGLILLIPKRLRTRLLTYWIAPKGSSVHSLPNTHTRQRQTSRRADSFDSGSMTMRVGNLLRYRFLCVGYMINLFATFFGVDFRDLSSPKALALRSRWTFRIVVLTVHSLA